VLQFVLTFQTAAIDFDNDFDTDLIVVNASIPLRAGETINRITALIFFFFSLSDRVHLQMESLAYVSHESALPGCELWVDGNLVFHQLHALSVYRSYTSYTSGLYEAVNITSIEDTRIPPILGRYLERSETTRLENVDSYWTAGLPGDEPEFRLRLNFRIPPQQIRYIPDVVETLKFAWIQYISLFFPIFFFIDLLMYLVFSLQIFDTLHTRDSNAFKQHQF